MTFRSRFWFSIISCTSGVEANSLILLSALSTKSETMNARSFAIAVSCSVALSFALLLTCHVTPRDSSSISTNWIIIKRFKKLKLRSFFFRLSLLTVHPSFPYLAILPSYLLFAEQSAEQTFFLFCTFSQLLHQSDVLIGLLLLFGCGKQVIDLAAQECAFRSPRHDHG